MHNCTTDNGSFGSPILNLQTNKVIGIHNKSSINPLASPSAGAPVLKYGDVNTETTSPGEVKGLIII